MSKRRSVIFHNIESIFVKEKIVYSLLLYSLIVYSPLLGNKNKFNIHQDNNKNNENNTWLKKYNDTLGEYITFSGYVKHEAFFDSRQVVGVHGDQFLLFPERRVNDVNKEDINAKSQFNMVALETRLHSNITGPDVLDAHTFAAIEADFAATLITLYRLRHAHLQLDWDALSLLVGQYWHPLYVPECYPNTISVNSGGPIEAFSRNPQIRVTYHCGSVDVITAALSQSSSFSDGPDGINSKYLRNATVPNLHVQLQAHIKEHVFGIGGDFKRLVPRIVTDKNIKVTESINSFAALAYAAFNWETVHINTKIIFNQNSTDHSMLGGYAVKSVDKQTEKREYTNINNISLWLDLTISKKVEPGIFIGYTKNLGARTEIIPTGTDQAGNTIPFVFSLGRVREEVDQGIDHVIRVSPRVRWHLEPVVFGAELEYTRAAFGTINNKGKIDNPVPVNNVRFLLAAYYFF